MFSGVNEDFLNWFNGEVRLLSGLTAQSVISDPNLCALKTDRSVNRKHVFPGQVIKLQAANSRLPASRVVELAHVIVTERTPFNLKDVYIIPAPSEHGDVTSSFYLVKRATFDPWLSELARANGRVHDFGILDEGHNRFLPTRLLLEFNGSVDQVRNWKQFLASMTVLLMVACSLTYAHILMRYSAAEDVLARTLELKRSEALEVRKLLDIEHRNRVAVETLTKSKRETPQIVEIWEELTKILPDDTWLTDLSVDGSVIKMTGFARKSAASLVALLETSKLFSEPSFLSPVVRVPGQSGERFEIQFRLRAE
jgi:general secretion pathway protein L